MYVFTQPLRHEQDITLNQFYKKSTAGLNSVFYFSKTGRFTKIKEPSLSYL